MQSNPRILHVTKYVCVPILVVGVILFFYGFVNDFANIVGIGYGTIMGGVFIFIMGLFLVATEEVLERNKNENNS
ncbi:hypothetical protein GMD78_05010 [Ornithinibacillus sp. L9]|uniref:Uncharacterized protein n=1 Tax=Ornithinibacillus caprae TaxID=2678566 RepID=A0A6N8FEZ5_9BACI|nr:hypothetical protein [Ornithinibacillus caprae]MUK87761.1 hypothetical protein [Ornithinibacillus caprae]